MVNPECSLGIAGSMICESAVFLLASMVDGHCGDLRTTAGCCRAKIHDAISDGHGKMTKDLPTLDPMGSFHDSIAVRYTWFREPLVVTLVVENYSYETIEENNIH